MKKIIVLLFTTLLLAACNEVEVKLPKALFAEMTDEEILALKDEQGYESVEIENDSIVLTMTKDKNKELKQSIEEDIEQTIKELTGDEASFLTKIEANNALDHFIFVGEEAKFDESFAIYAELSILMNAYYYHFFDGKDQSSIKIEYEYRDPSTGETYRSETYPKTE